MKDYLLPVGLLVVVILLLLLGIVMLETGAHNQPCSTYQDQPVKDVPVRCLKELTK